MNEQELVQRALIDVAQDPSSYYQGFVEDQLPLTKNISEEQFVSLLSTGDETKTKKVLQELASDKKALTSIVKKFQQKSQASMFKEGGKFDYLKKLQGGEKIPGDRKPKGIKGLFFEATKHPREDNQPGYISEYVTPAGDTTTVVGGRWNSWQRIAKNGQQPIYQIAVGSDTYKPTFDPEAIEMLNKVHGRFIYPVKEQEGGRLTRRQALEDAEKNKGFNRSQARRAYQNAKAGLRAQGYSGSEMRQAARQAISGVNEPVVKREELPAIATIQAPQGLQYVEQKLNALPIAPNYNNLDFKKRFRLARNAGDKTFNWRGKTYTTQYKEEVLPPEPPKNLVFPGAAPIVPELEFELDDRGELPIVMSYENTPIRYNNDVTFYNGKFYNTSELPAVLHRPDVYPSFSYKSGGKLAKENEINKKYIKDSEKAGAKASKEMSDLKAKHKKEISKLKKK